MKKTDEELLSDIISNKDEKSFTLLYDRYSIFILNLINSRLSNTDEAADLLQDFWASIWLSPQLVRVDEKGCAKKSLQYILSKRILDYYRRVYRKIVLSKEVDYENQPQAEPFYSHVLEDLLLKEIEALVNALPKKERIIYNLRMKKQYSVKEIASMLGISEKTVQNRLSMISKKLRYQQSSLSILINIEIILQILDRIEYNGDNFL